MVILIFLFFCARPFARAISNRWPDHSLSFHYLYLYKYIYKNINIFSYLKYKINADKDILNTYQTVDEGIENRLINYINKSKTIDDFIFNIKTKRYTYNKINRMFIHILTSFTKDLPSLLISSKNTN